MKKILINGEEHSMAFCPELPQKHPGIRELKNEDTELKKKAVPPIVFSTACWRGYIGTWKIEKDLFYLQDIVGRYELTQEEPILANWFTGVLRIPQGEILEYIHVGFGSVHEKELHIKIEKGKIIGEKVIDNSKKEFSPWDLTGKNFPGTENRFKGNSA